MGQSPPISESKSPIGNIANNPGEESSMRKARSTSHRHALEWPILTSEKKVIAIFGQTVPGSRQEK
jgi:hypothetical protein